MSQKTLTESQCNFITEALINSKPLKFFFQLFSIFSFVSFGAHMSFSYKTLLIFHFFLLLTSSFASFFCFSLFRSSKSSKLFFCSLLLVVWLLLKLYSLFIRHRRCNLVFSVLQHIPSSNISALLHSTR